MERLDKHHVTGGTTRDLCGPSYTRVESRKRERQTGGSCERSVNYPREGCRKERRVTPKERGETEGTKQRYP